MRNRSGSSVLCVFLQRVRFPGEWLNIRVNVVVVHREAEAHTQNFLGKFPKVCYRQKSKESALTV